MIFGMSGYWFVVYEYRWKFGFECLKQRFGKNKILVSHAVSLGFEVEDYDTLLSDGAKITDCIAHGLMVMIETRNGVRGPSNRRSWIGL